MRQHTGTAHSECICQNGDRHSGHDQDDRPPKPVVLQPTKALSGTRRIVRWRVAEVSEHYRERHESHQRTDAAASLDYLEFFSIKRVQWLELDDVSLSQHGNAEHTHGPHGAPRSEQLQ